MILKNKNTKEFHEAIKVVDQNSLIGFVDEEDILTMSTDENSIATIRTYSCKENKALKDTSCRVVKAGQYIVKERFGVYGVLNENDIERGYEIVR
jgi:Mg/Co/Ni transporter MgtE